MPTDPNFMSTARERYTYAMQCDAEERRVAKEDVDFVAGDQWEETAKAARIGAKRPVLTENRLQTFTAQVVNDGRQSKPSIKITPLDGGDPKTAEVIQSRIRHLEYESDADIAYDTAREHQVTSGRGFYRIRIRYADDRSFRQEPYLEKIDNQFSVLFDPAAVAYAREDAYWSFVVSSISKDYYKRCYGDKTTAARSGWFARTQNPAPDWIGIGKGGEEIQIAEYSVKEYTTRTLVRYRDVVGQVKIDWKEQVPADTEIHEARDVQTCIVMQYIIDGVDVLDKTQWLGSTIPIIPVWGKEMWVNGKRRTYSLVRFAKDPQRLVNLYVSNIAEQIAQMPKSPYIAAEGSILNHEDEWANINTSPLAVVQYKPQAIGEKFAGRPERVVNEPPIVALTQGYMQAVDAIKASMGIYDSSLGARSNETSGIAIQRRAKEADNANFHFHDNEARSRRYAGRILLELISKLDQGEATWAIRSEDGKTRSVKVNTKDPYRDDQTGEMVHYRLEPNAYGEAVSTGPSFTSARQEAFEMYSQIANADKNFMTVAGDVLFRNLDAPGADQIADRYEQGVIPPQLRPPKPGEQQPIPPQVQAQIQTLTKELDDAHAFAQSLHQQIATKQAELDSKKEIVAMQEDTKRTIALAQLQSSEGLALLRADVERIESQLDRMHQQSQQESDQQHQAEQAAQQQAAAAQQAQQEPQPVGA